MSESTKRKNIFSWIAANYFIEIFKVAKNRFRRKKYKYQKAVNSIIATATTVSAENFIKNHVVKKEDTNYFFTVPGTDKIELSWLNQDFKGQVSSLRELYNTWKDTYNQQRKANRGVKRFFRFFLSDYFTALEKKYPGDNQIPRRFAEAYQTMQKKHKSRRHHAFQMLLSLFQKEEVDCVERKSSALSTPPTSETELTPPSQPKKDEAREQSEKNQHQLLSFLTKEGKLNANEVIKRREEFERLVVAEQAALSDPNMNAGIIVVSLIEEAKKTIKFALSGKSSFNAAEAAEITCAKIFLKAIEHETDSFVKEANNALSEAFASCDDVKKMTDMVACYEFLKIWSGEDAVAPYNISLREKYPAWLSKMVFDADFRKTGLQQPIVNLFIKSNAISDSGWIALSKSSKLEELERSCQIAWAKMPLSLTETEMKREKTDYIVELIKQSQFEKAIIALSALKNAWPEDYSAQLTPLRAEVDKLFVDMIDVLQKSETTVETCPEFLWFQQFNQSPLIKELGLEVYKKYEQLISDGITVCKNLLSISNLLERAISVPIKLFESLKSCCGKNLVWIGSVEKLNKLKAALGNISHSNAAQNTAGELFEIVKKLVLVENVNKSEKEFSLLEFQNYKSVIEAAYQAKSVRKAVREALADLFSYEHIQWAMKKGVLQKCALEEMPEKNRSGKCALGTKIDVNYFKYRHAYEIQAALLAFEICPVTEIENHFLKVEAVLTAAQEKMDELGEGKRKNSFRFLPLPEGKFYTSIVSALKGVQEQKESWRSSVSATICLQLPCSEVFVSELRLVG